jgi:hypothetical protein
MGPAGFFSLRQSLISAQPSAQTEQAPFVPIDAVDRLVTADAIKRALAPPAVYGLPPTEDVISKILRKAKRLFAILTYIDRLDQLQVILEKHWSDAELPITALNISRLSLENDRFFLDQFQEKQYLFLAPVFTRLGEHIEVLPRSPLPFSWRDPVKKITRYSEVF